MESLRGEFFATPDVGTCATVHRVLCRTDGGNVAQGRRNVALTVVALALGVAGCASTAPNRGTRPPRDVPSSAVRSSSANTCGGNRGAALSTFNGDGSSRWSIELPVDEVSQAALIADHEVIYSGHAGSVSAVRVVDGSVEWDAPLGASIYALWLIDGLVVANVDQVSDHPKIVGLDPATGATRWTYLVPGGGFLGDAVVTDGGGLAFRVADTGMLTVIDASSGDVRWSRNVRDGRSSDDLPSAASGLVLYVDAEEQMFALDARTGSLRWQVPAGQTGRVVVSENVGVVVPDFITGPTITVVAHSLEDGAELWRRQPADLSAVFPDQDGFLLADYRADTMTLVRATTAAQVWQAQLPKIELDDAPTSLGPDGAIAVLESGAVAFVDRDTGNVRQVSAPAGGGYTAAHEETFFLGSGTQVLLLAPTGVSWTAPLPHYTQSDPAALTDGGVAVQSEDPTCATAT